MYNTILALHISFAVALGLVVLLSYASIAFQKSEHYLKLIYILGAGLLVQAVTGSLIEITSAHPALFLVFCSKIVLYLGVVVVTQIVLFTRLVKLNMPVSFKYIAYCTLSTIAMMGATGLLIK